MSIDLGDQYTADFDDVSELEWNALLMAFADATFYDTWAYAVVRCGQRRVSRMVVRRNGVAVALAQTRLYKVPFLPCGIAYVHQGPVWRRMGEPLNPIALQKALVALKTEFAHRRRFGLRLHPPVDDCGAGHESIRRTFLDLGFSPSKRGRILLVDLRPPLEDLRKGLGKSWRNHLKCAEKSQLCLTDGATEELLESYAQIHREMVTRKGLKDDGGLSDVARAFRRLPVALRPRVVLAVYDGRPIAGAVVSMIGKTGMQLLVSAGNATATEVSGTWRGNPVTYASNLVQWRCIEILKRLALERYDLSSINPEKNPGTYQFKAGLCGKNGIEIQIDGFTYSPSRLASAILASGLRLRSALRGRALPGSSTLLRPNGKQS